MFGFELLGFFSETPARTTRANYWRGCDSEKLHFLVSHSPFLRLSNTLSLQLCQCELAAAAEDLYLKAIKRNTAKFTFALILLRHCFFLTALYRD